MLEDTIKIIWPTKDWDTKATYVGAIFLQKSIGYAPKIKLYTGMLNFVNRYKLVYTPSILSSRTALISMAAPTLH